MVGFEKGGDVDKSLKAAKMNALKNTKTEDSDDDDDDSSDEEVDLAALKNGEADMDDDDDASSDEEDLDLDNDDDDSEDGFEVPDDDDDEEDELAAKIMSKAKNTQKKLGKNEGKKGKVSPAQAVPVKQAAAENDSDISSDDEEETNL